MHYAPALRFIPIELSATRDLCIQFRADSFYCSFGSSTDFFGADNQGGLRYVERLAEFLRRDPGSCLHVVDDEKIIGQIELGIIEPDSRRGHVFLYYLIPERRGLGLGARLHERAMEYFRAHSAAAIGLRVSPSNERAIRFYTALGWKLIGRSRRDPRLVEMKWVETE